MQQNNYEEEFAMDLDELRSLSPGPPRLFQFGPDGNSINYVDNIKYQRGVLKFQNYTSNYYQYYNWFDLIDYTNKEINNLKREQDLNYDLNNRSQVLRIQKLQYLPWYFRQEQWDFTLLNQMQWMKANNQSYHEHYFFILAEQLIFIIKSLHQNGVAHNMIIAENIVIKSGNQYNWYRFNYLEKPDKKQYYKYILTNNDWSDEGEEQDLSNRIKQKTQSDIFLQKLYLENKLSSEISDPLSFVQKIINLNIQAKLDNREITMINFTSIQEYQCELFCLTNFRNSQRKDDQIQKKDWLDCQMKDYHDLGIILHQIYIQTQNNQTQINQNLANEKEGVLRQQIIGSLNQNKNIYEKILLILLDGQQFEYFEQFEQAIDQVLQNLPHHLNYYNRACQDQVDLYPS